MRCARSSTCRRKNCCSAATSGSSRTAASTTPPTAERPRRIAVAYSGGRDSTALLHATLHAAAAASGVEVVALHVHHGLSRNADAWLAAAEAQCRRWRRRGWPVSFASHRVDGAPPAGDSIEAWARQARYAALAALAQAHGCTVVLLGQHRLDQAETVLLQALRGAGPAGLAGMPRRIERHGVAFVRPWLDRPRHEIEAYVRRHRLCFVDDDSNADPRFARNRLRLQVWPSLTAAFDQAEAALATVARRAQDAQALIDEIASADLALVAPSEALHIDAWRGLSPVRRTHALLAWLRRGAVVGVTTHLIERLAAELPSARSARWSVGGDELRAYRGCLRLARAAPAPSITPARESSLRITRAGRYALPGWRGSLRVDRVAEGGVPLVAIERLELRARVGGERFQAGLKRPPRDLKRQYQAASVAAWERAGPLFFSGERLVFVPGLGLDARVVGVPGEALVMLHWLAHDGGE